MDELIGAYEAAKLDAQLYIGRDTGVAPWEYEGRVCTAARRLADRVIRG